MTDFDRQPLGAVYSVAKDLLPPQLRRRLLYARAHGRPARLHPPETFSEKVTWRMLYDRRPLIAMTGDKLASKDYARSTAADLVTVPQTLWQGRDVTPLAAVDLPDHWVLKPNHSCRRVYFGHGRPDVDELARATQGWLGEPLSRAGEWSYSQATQVLLVEQLIGVPGQSPADYKVFVFDGEPVLVQVDSDRYGSHRRSLYTKDWHRLPVKTPVDEPDADEARPELLDQILQSASRLGQAFDFVRVDLYSVAGRVYFGELTVYPGGGVQPYRPASFDLELGRRWSLPVR